MPKIQLHSGLLLRPLRNFGIDRVPEEIDQDTPEMTPAGPKKIETSIGKHRICGGIVKKQSLRPPNEMNDAIAMIKKERFFGDFHASSTAREIAGAASVLRMLSGHGRKELSMPAHHSSRTTRALTCRE
jgi:hypothetical protein